MVSSVCRRFWQEISVMLNTRSATDPEPNSNTTPGALTPPPLPRPPRLTILTPRHRNPHPTAPQPLSGRQPFLAEWRGTQVLLLLALWRALHARCMGCATDTHNPYAMFDQPEFISHCHWLFWICGLVFWASSHPPPVPPPSVVFCSIRPLSVKPYE